MLFIMATLNVNGCCFAGNTWYCRFCFCRYRRPYRHHHRVMPSQSQAQAQAQTRSTLNKLS